MDHGMERKIREQPGGVAMVTPFFPRGAFVENSGVPLRQSLRTDAEV